MQNERRQKLTINVYTKLDFVIQLND